MIYNDCRIQVYRDGCGGHDPAYPWFVAVTVPNTDQLEEIASFSTHAEAIDYATQRR